MAKLFSTPFANTGDKTEIPETAEGSINYTTGYTAEYSRNLATDSTALPIERDRTNQFFYDATDNLFDWQKNTFPPHQNIEYEAGSIVRFSNKNWISKRRNTSVPTEGDDWTEFVITDASNENFGRTTGDIPIFNTPSKDSAIDAIVSCGTNANGSWWLYQSGSILMAVRLNNPQDAESTLVTYNLPITAPVRIYANFIISGVAITNTNANQVQFSTVEGLGTGRYRVSLYPGYQSGSANGAISNCTVSFTLFYKRN